MHYKYRLIPVIWHILLVCLIVCSFISCGSQHEQTAGGYGSIIVHAVWPDEATGAHAAAVFRTAPVGVSTVRMIVSGPGMSDMQSDFAGSAGTGPISGVPAGSSRKVSLQGLSSSGTIIYTGQSSLVTVTDGGTSTTNTIVIT